MSSPSLVLNVFTPFQHQSWVQTSSKSRISYLNQLQMRLLASFETFFRTVTKIHISVNIIKQTPNVSKIPLTSAHYQIPKPPPRFTSRYSSESTALLPKLVSNSFIPLKWTSAPDIQIAGSMIQLKSQKICPNTTSTAGEGGEDHSWVVIREWEISQQMLTQVIWTKHTTYTES